MRYRTVDMALYEKRAKSFDYDMIVSSFGQSQSPGNEQFDMWHSKSADKPGSRNALGLKNPVIDALVEKLVYAHDREALVTAARALDRALLWGEYVVPNWYIDSHRVVYWDKFGKPAQFPLYYSNGESWMTDAWWRKN
jgi:microcin C transport system substrate-binding protein